MYKKIKNSNLSSYKMRLLINEWVYGTPARICAQKIHVNRNTVNFWYTRIRQGILSLPSPAPFQGEVEIDESYFGQKRPGIYGTGMTDRVPIFGMRERTTGRVWTTVVEGTDHTFLIPIIQQRIQKGSTIYSDGFGAYYHLSNFGYEHHVVYHNHTYVTSRIVHTNGIESFWAFAKKFFQDKKGLPRSHYQIHLKEAEIRFNTREPQKLRLLVRHILHQ